MDAARQELQKLPASGCDMKMLLAHLVRTDLDRVLKEVPGFDIAAVAHEGWQGPPQSSSGIPVVYVGQRGRTLFRVDLESAGGSEPLVDLGAIERARQESESLDRRIEDTKKQNRERQGPHRIQGDPAGPRASAQGDRRRPEEGHRLPPPRVPRRAGRSRYRGRRRSRSAEAGAGLPGQVPADAADRPPPPMIGPSLPPRSGKLPAGMFPATPPPAMLQRPGGPPPALPPAAFKPAPAHTAPIDLAAEEPCGSRS